MGDKKENIVMFVDAIQLNNKWKSSFFQSVLIDDIEHIKFRIQNNIKVDLDDEDFQEQAMILTYDQVLVLNKYFEAWLNETGFFK